MRREDRRITEDNEIVDILHSAEIVHLGLMDGGYPYIVPLHYGFIYEDGKLTLYMHGAVEGKKLDLIRSNENAFIEIDNNNGIVSGGEIPCRYGAAYASIMAKGKAEIVENVEEKIKGLELLMSNQTHRNFEITPMMTRSVSVIKFSAEEMSAKARKVAAK